MVLSTSYPTQDYIKKIFFNYISKGFKKVFLCTFSLFLYYARKHDIRQMQIKYKETDPPQIHNYVYTVPYLPTNSTHD